MSDQLDTLSDAELSETFAVEVCKTLKRESPRDGGLRAYSVVGTGAWREIREEGAWGWPEDFVDYAKSADAVMPWLDKLPWRAQAYEEGIRVGFSYPVGTNGICYTGGVVAKSFARAACIALIRVCRHHATNAVQSSAS